MTQQTINVPQSAHHGALPGVSDSSERGDGWKTADDKINANFTELYDAEADDAALLARLWLLGVPRLIASDAVLASHTGDTNEMVIKTYTIPGGSIGPNGYIKIEFVGFAGASNANVKTIRPKLGGNLLVAASLASAISTKLELWVAADGANDAQNYLQIGGFTTTSGSVQTGALDMTQDQSLTISALLADAGDTVGVQMVRIETVYKA